MRGLELIFLHVPKTAGISLRQLICGYFGDDRVFLDYAESPANPISPCNLDPAGYYSRVRSDVDNIVESKSAVYGHFPILKYRECRSFRATFLRNPIERALSQYYFWKHMPASSHPLHAYFLQANLTLSEFFQLPHVKGFYTEIFFPNDEVRRFDFVGNFDRFAAEAKRLGNALGLNFPEVAVENANPDPKYKEYRDAFLCDRTAMAAATDAIRAEIAFYEENVGK